MKTLVLFDIDKTLIDSSSAHREAFSQAFKKVYGIETTIDIINPHGMTDQQIIIEVLKKKGIEEKTIRSKIFNCMKEMVRFFHRGIKQDKIHVLNGVQELLKTLQKHNVIIGLVTGNLEPIARGKLAKVGINEYFKVGGFGSDYLERTELVKIAIKKAVTQFSFRKNKNVFLFGDTPQDIKAGERAGVYTIGVATGTYTEAELSQAGATATLKNLANTEKILRIINKKPE